MSIKIFIPAIGMALSTVSLHAVAQTNRYVSSSGTNTTNNCSLPGNPCATINNAIAQAANGDVIVVNDGTYYENVNISKNVSLRSVNGAATTIIDGSNASSMNGTVVLATGVNGIYLGNTGHGFTIKGIDGVAASEKAAVYIAGIHTNLVIEGNTIEARGDLALLSESQGIDGLVINNNTFTGQTFNGTPAGTGGSAQFTLQNVVRQGVVVSGGATVTELKNITFTNNTISLTASGISTTDNTGATTAPHITGNTLVTIDAVGSVIITGNTFSGTNLYTEALRTRGAGTHTISDNIFNGSYANVFSAATTVSATGVARATAVFQQNTMRAAYASNANTINSKISSAIAAASAGATVKVTAGTFNEDVTINKSITLTGATALTTIINGEAGGSSKTIQVTANNVTMKYITVTRDYGNTLSGWQASADSFGIYINQTSGTVMDMITVKGNMYGIYGFNSPGTTVKNSIIENNTTGLSFGSDFSSSTIRNNFIRNNFTIGIVLNAAAAANFSNTIVNENSFTGNWYASISYQNPTNAAISATATSGFSLDSNWFGTILPRKRSAATTQPDYVAQVPSFFGGSAPVGSSPFNADVAGSSAYYIAVTRILNTGVDFVPGEENGFQASPNSLLVLDNPLALRLIDFQVAKKDGQAIIAWQVANPADAAGYTIERMYDNETVFTEVKQVQPGTQYSYTATDEINGTHTTISYRLKCIDKDGSEYYSAVRMVKNTAAVSVINIYPTVTNGEVRIETVSGSTTRWHIMLCDMSGRVLIKTTSSEAAVISLQQYPVGTYILTVLSDDQTVKQTTRIIRK